MDALTAPLTVKGVLIAALVLGFAPAFVLRLCTLAWPVGHPRRAELRAELHAIDYWKRPLWAAEQVESALFDGLRQRATCRAERERSDSSSAQVRRTWAMRRDRVQAFIKAASGLPENPLNFAFTTFSRAFATVFEVISTALETMLRVVQSATEASTSRFLSRQQARANTRVGRYGYAQS